MLFWFGGGILWTYYSYHRPPNYNAHVGRVYVLYNHGKTVYLTWGEHYFLCSLLALGAMFLLLLAILDWWDKAEAKRGHDDRSQTKN
jgi:hypothetical protein